MPTSRRITPRKVVPVQKKPGSRVRATAEAKGEVMVHRTPQGARSRQIDLGSIDFGPNEHPANVRVAAGLTINTGNFQSLRLDVSVSLPCRVDEVETAYENASQYAAEFLSEEEARWMANEGGRKHG